MSDHPETILKNAGLKITPQRIAILDAIKKLDNHPSAEMIIDYIRKTHPHIASGTVYKVLDTLVEKDILTRVKTEKDLMRYEFTKGKHHHLYCSDSEKIEDYVDQELDQLIENYFKDKKIKNFEIKDIRLQINGKFVKSSKTN